MVTFTVRFLFLLATALVGCRAIEELLEEPCHPYLRHLKGDRELQKPIDDCGNPVPTPTISRPTPRPTPRPTLAPVPQGGGCCWTSKSIWNDGLHNQDFWGCKITMPANGGCNYYAKAFYVGLPNDGTPRTYNDLGTGCIKDWSGSFCYYSNPQYPLTTADRQAMCTDNAVQNGAAQLWWGLFNGYCDYALFYSHVTSRPITCDPFCYDP